MSGDILSDFERYEREHEAQWRQMSVPALSRALQGARHLWRSTHRGGTPVMTRHAISENCRAIRAELRARAIDRRAGRAE